MTKYLDNEGLTHFTGKMKEYADGKAGEVDSKVTSHISDKKNPHGVTKAQVGLDKVDNVQQIPLSQRGKANGVATLDANGKVPTTQMPETKTINGESIFGKGNLQLSASLYKIVDTLPTTGIDTSKIYLVPASATTAKNNKTEYIYLGDPNKAYDESKWEKLGDEQKNTTVTTPGGSITVDTAFDTTSSNPIANKTVTDKFGLVDKALAGKVARDTYDAKMATIDSTLAELGNKTIEVDAELKVSTNPVQNTAVKKAVDDLNTAIGKKANSTALTTANSKITTLETNAATILTVTGTGNGISGISKSGNTITATKGNFLTSAAGLVTTADLNKGLTNKADVNHNHDDKYAAKTHTHSEYALSSALNDYVTNTALSEKKFLTDTALSGYVNDVKPDGTSGNGITSITKVGKALKVTKATFLTEHQSLAEYVNSVDKATSDLPYYNGFAVSYMQKNGNELEFELKPFFNTLDIEDTAKKDGNGIAEISIGKTKNLLHVKKGKFITETTLGTAIKDYASQQGYLTKENLNEKLKETVTIKLVSDKSASDTNLNGATITVKSGNTTVSTQTWQGTPIKVEVPCDKEVTIEAAVVKMYVKPKMLKYVPSPLYNREVTFTYKALETGVFVIDTNNNLINKDSWNPQTQQTTVGVALITEKVAIVISVGVKTGRAWSTTTQLVEGVTTATNSTVAVTDYKGKANTEALVEALGQNAQAAYYCSNYTFKNGKKGYLMAAGEANAIYVNIRTISELLNYINPNSSNLSSGDEIWTSTQCNISKAWRHDAMGCRTLSKDVDNNYVVPIYSLYD
nr:MAG TPA: structural protein [Caudoviricetes sp.]